MVLLASCRLPIPGTSAKYLVPVLYRMIPGTRMIKMVLREFVGVIVRFLPCAFTVLCLFIAD